MTRAQERATRWLIRISKAERAITFVAFLVLIAVVFGDVVARELTGTGLHWARQAGVYANIFIVMLGIGVASSEGAHLRPRFADRWLPERFQPSLVRLQEWVMAGFCAAFAVAATLVVFESWQLQERSSVLMTLVWPVQTVIPIVFSIAALRHGAYAVYPALRPRENAAGFAGITEQTPS